MMGMRCANHLFVGKAKQKPLHRVTKPTNQFQFSQRRYFAEDDSKSNSKSESEKLFETIFGSSSKNEEPLNTTSKEETTPDRQETIGKMNYIFSTVFGTNDRFGGGAASRRNTTGSAKQLEDLKYIDYYPKEVKKWVEDAKTPLGYYDWLGIWRAVTPNSSIVVNNTDNLVEAIRLVGKGETRTFRKMYAPIARERLEPDLIDVYRFGLTKEDVAGLSTKLKQVLSFRFAPDREIKKYRMERECEKWRKFEGDTGNAAVQIVRFTFAINALQEHTTKSKKDKPAKRHLQILISRRRKMMQYLKYRDVKTYYEIVKEYLLEDVLGSVNKHNHC